MSEKDIMKVLNDILKRLDALESKQRKPAPKAADAKVADADDPRAIAHIASKFGGTVDTPAAVQMAARGKQKADVDRIEAINEANRKAYGRR